MSNKWDNFTDEELGTLYTALNTWELKYYPTATQMGLKDALATVIAQRLDLEI